MSQKHRDDLPKRLMDKVKNLKQKDEELREVRKDLEELRAFWLKVPGVTGLDIGYKIREGTALTQEPLRLRLHVQKKLKKRDLKEVPKWQIFPADIGDVIEATYRAQPYIGTMKAEDATLRGRLDPLVGGASVGNQWSANTGTLGLVVWDKTDGRPCILSNWHVIARGKWMLPGSPIYQPGPYDGAMVQDRIAILKRWLFNEQMDAALAELTGDRAYAACAIWCQRPVGIVRKMKHIRPGLKLRKSGRTTCSTRGIVEGYLGAYLVDYAGGPRLLTDQVRIGPDPDPPETSEEDPPPTSPVSQPGDSGAVWLYEPGGGRAVCRPVGLHFAGDGSGLGQFALATPMETVAKELKFSVTPEFVMSQEDLEAMKFTSARALAGSQPVGDPIGAAGSQPVGDPIGGAGSQPVGDPIGGAGSQPVGDPIGGAGSQPVGDPIGG